MQVLCTANCAGSCQHTVIRIGVVLVVFSLFTLHRCILLFARVPAGLPLVMHCTPRTSPCCCPSRNMTSCPNAQQPPARLSCSLWVGAGQPSCTAAMAFFQGLSTATAPESAALGCPCLLVYFTPGSSLRLIAPAVLDAVHVTRLCMYGLCLSKPPAPESVVLGSD